MIVVSSVFPLVDISREFLTFGGSGVIYLHVSYICKLSVHFFSFVDCLHQKFHN